jgi:hypothetical protein
MSNIEKFSKSIKYFVEAKQAWVIGNKFLPLRPFL